MGFISYLGMAYPDAEVGLLPTLESPWASFSSRWCLSTAEEGEFYIRKHLQRSPRYEGSQVTPCYAQPSLGLARSNSYFKWAYLRLKIRGYYKSVPF